MKKLRSFALMAILLCSVFSAAFAESEVPCQLVNGGFETASFGSIAAVRITLFHIIAPPRFRIMHGPS